MFSASTTKPPICGIPSLPCPLSLHILMKFLSHGLKALLPRGCYTVECFVQLVSQCFCDIIAGQVARNISLCTYPATAKIVARQIARKVELNSTFGNGSCNLSRNDFGRCRVCLYTVKCFVQLVSQCFGDIVAGQVA